MATISIEQFISELRQIPANDFSRNIYPFLRANPVGVESLAKFSFWSRNGYTRNLVYKNELFEVLAVCWNVGQASLIHDHADQNCWMSMPLGKLRIKNYRVAEQDSATHFCRVEETIAFDLTPDLPAEVEDEEPLHQVLNLSEFNERAISLHVYSRPFERCFVYSLNKNEKRERTMCYTSVNGQLCHDARL